MLTALDTPLHTNVTVYNPKIDETSTRAQEISDDNQEKSRYSTRRNINDYNDYKTGKFPPSPVIVSYTDDANLDKLDYRLSVDCAMAVEAGITSSEDPIWTVWTVFNSKTSNVKTHKSKTGFFPVKPQPRSDSGSKYYLDFLLDLKSDLEINHIFRHSDLDVFYKIFQII